MADTVDFIIKTYNGKNYFQTISDLDIYLKELHKELRKDKSNYELSHLAKCIDSLLTYLGPINMIDNVDCLKEFLPLIKNLVNNGFMKKEILDPLK